MLARVTAQHASLLWTLEEISHFVSNSGHTSGQKVVLNGGLNLSILDGWWAEAYDGHNGFAIGRGETHTSIEAHDARCRVARQGTSRRSHPGVLRPRQRWTSPATDRANEARHPHARLAVQCDRMVTDYVLKAYIPAGGGTSSEMRS
jgi:starch phosphorylase